MIYIDSEFKEKLEYLLLAMEDDPLLMEMAQEDPITLLLDYDINPQKLPNELVDHLLDNISNPNLEECRQHIWRIFEE